MQLGHIDLDESVQQRFRQAFSSSALVLGILGGKEAKVWVLGKRASDVGDVNRAAVIQARVQTFQDRLRCEVHFIQQDPCTALHRIEEGGRSPCKLAWTTVFDRQLATE